jgi:hypothetical protein
LRPGGHPEPHPSTARCIWPCLDACLASLPYSVSFISTPPSRMAPSSRFPLPSRCRTTRCTHGTKAHMSYTQNSHPYMQPNKISSRTGPTTKTAKHDWVHGLSMHLTILDRLSIPAPHHQSNQSPLIKGTTYADYSFNTITVGVYCSRSW